MHLATARSLAALLFFCMTTSLTAQTENLIQWHGFLTTGAAVTDSDNKYQGLTQKPRIAEETYLGLNLSKDLNDHWRVAAQFIGRADESDSAVKIDWAFVTYDPRPGFEITAGKQNVAMWMISEYRYIGRAYPWVNPPEEVYTLFDLSYFTGVSLGVNIPLGFSNLSIRPYAGDVLIEVAPNAPDVDTKLRGRNMMGLGLEWSLHKFLLRAGVNQTSWDLNLGPNFAFGTRDYRVVSYGLRAEVFGLDLLSEYAYTEDLDQKKYEERGVAAAIAAAEALAAGDTVQAESLSAQARNFQLRIGGSRAYYVTLGKQLGSFYPHLTLANLKKPEANGLRRDQESQALGVNYDIDLDSVIKLESKRVHTPDRSRGLFQNVIEDSDAMIYRISYSLVF